MDDVKIWDFWANKYEKLWVQKYSLSPTRRDIIKEIKKIVELNKAYNVLDMGSGTGQLIVDMQREFEDYNIKYTGVDISSKMIDIAKSNDSLTTYYNCSVEDFSMENKYFDIIICSHSFPYYPNKAGVIMKFYSLLKDTGSIFLAQASANSTYDNIAMFFVKFTTSSAKYLSALKIQTIIKDRFVLLKTHKIKEKGYMPTICLFVLKKEIKE